MKKRSVEILESLAIIFLSISGAIGVVVALLDLFSVDLFSSILIGIKEPSQITLLIVGFLALGVGLERIVTKREEEKYKSLEDRLRALENVQEQSVHLIIDSLDGVEVVSFDSEIEWLTSLNQKISKAKIQIDDASWGTNSDQRNYRFDQMTKVYFEYMRRANVASKKIPYREIYFFDRPSRIERLKKRMNNENIGYSCGYLKELRVPLLEFVIIDKEEVCIHSSKYDLWLSVKHQHIVNLFSIYYDEIWSLSTTLKQGRDFYWDEIVNIIGQEATNELRKL